MKKLFDRINCNTRAKLTEIFVKFASMRKISTILIAAAMLFASGCGSNNSKTSAAGKTETGAAEPDSIQVDSTAAVQKELTVMEKIATLPEEPVFEMVTSLGTMKIKLYKNTPKHRENFAKLALSGFYNGILFHRVINGFMIQGGDPLSKDPANKDQWGTGGPGYNVPAEFVPEYNHKKGALAAARRGDAVNPYKESSGSQFYIVQDARACAQLDGQYTVYGEVIEGLNVIDDIASVATDYRDRPQSDVKIIAIKLAE